jgi:hypothetical protein
MQAMEVKAALDAAMLEAGVTRSMSGPKPLRFSECDLYRAIRGLMHRMDGASGKLDPKRYGYKAVAGAMRELLKVRGCEDVSS